MQLLCPLAQQNSGSEEMYYAAVSIPLDYTALNSGGMVRFWAA